METNSKAGPVADIPKEELMPADKELEALSIRIKQGYETLVPKLEKLKKNELLRVAIAIIGHPLEDYKGLTSEREKDLATRGVLLKRDIFQLGLEYIKLEQESKDVE